MQEPLHFLGAPEEHAAQDGAGDAQGMCLGVGQGEG